ncbi:probable apyrase 7 [Rutidosis leptorrhynchoides]|uniref:probable apyrase 7 n=1 Tax=Rutidosis leptorrhynchoides TaxID=125765 RepID=UPI003A99F045
MEPKSPSKLKLPALGYFHHFTVLKITIITVTVILLILTGYYLFYNPRFATNTSYFTVVLDCGSSGTRVNIYEWMLKDSLLADKDSKLPILLHSYPDKSTKIDDFKDGCAYHCMQTEPGLDKFVGNASGVKSSIEPLIRRAEKWVPYERRKDTPIFVLATAGLRRLSTDAANEVLDDVESIVKLHDFKYKKDWIRILSGEEEAYYGWLALNHHMGIFGNSSKLPTLGLLDLGGSSLQVATETREPILDVHVSFKSKIGAFEHQIMAVSLPAFGLNEGFDRTVVMLSKSLVFVDRELGSFEIGHPCLRFGFMQNYTCYGCFKGNSSRYMRENEFLVLNLVGKPNWEKCKVLARAAATNSSSISDRSKRSDDSYCTGPSSVNGEMNLNLFGGTHSVSRFHALSGFYAVYKLLNLNSSTTISKIWEKGEELCSRSLAGLTNMSINQKYAELLCFRVPYIVSLIEKTVCVGNKDIVFGPRDISWTLGAALVEGKNLWLSDTFRAQSIVSNLTLTRVILSPYFLFVLLAFLLFVVYRSQIKLPMLGRKVTSIPPYINSKRSPA